MDGLATSAELAEYLNVKPQTLRNWVHLKKGPPFVMVEGARRYDMTEVKQWLEERTVRHG